jgi:hypothetical protein
MTNTGPADAAVGIPNAVGLNALAVASQAELHTSVLRLRNAHGASGYCSRQHVRAVAEQTAGCSLQQLAACNITTGNLPATCSR